MPRHTPHDPPLPRYSDPAFFNSLPLIPPFYFDSITTRVLPLRSSLASLQNMLDQYLNFIPPEVGRFQAVVPYTYLMMIDYGKLAAQAANIGWLSQHEVMFAVPAAWYASCRGEWKYQGLVWVTPFIFVDNDIALTLGRWVYGWPKLRQFLEPEVAEWMNNPTGDVRKATLSTAVFSELYAGKTQEPRMFCEVVHPPSPSAAIPPDLSNPFWPWSMWENAFENTLEAGRAFMGTLAGLGVFPGNGYASPDNFFAMAMDGLGALNPENPDIKFNTLNLKQFRFSEAPNLYSFQALTAAAMKVVGFNRAGPLGGMRQLGLDSSGGYRVRLAKWPQLPIVDTLGLEVDRTWRGDGVDLVEIEPVNPFWYDIDMSYERGVNLCWRSFDRIWHTPDGKTFRKPDREDVPRGTPMATRETIVSTDRLFNTTLPDTNQTIAGPFEYLDSTVRVLPLLADPEVLSQFLDEYLNEPLSTTDPQLSFEVWTKDYGDDHRGDKWAYVYLVVTRYGSISSGTDNIGDWAGEDACFHIPVRWYEGGELRGVGLVPVFTYVSTTASTISDTEILGWPTAKSVFKRPPTAWLDDPAPDAPESLLSVSTEVLPSIAEGQQLVERQVVEVRQGRGPADQEPWRLGADWVGPLRAEVQAKNRCKQSHSGERFERSMSMALELLRGKHPINVFTLKQFRDVCHPDRACYQSLVRVPQTIQYVYDLRAINQPLHVRISQYPSQEIINVLGLKGTLTQKQDGGQDYVVIPQSPFWARIKWREDLGQSICYRVDEQWRRSPSEHSLEWQPYFHPASTAEGLDLHDRRYEGDPIHEPHDFIHRQTLDHADARAAVESFDAQMFLETIRAREWGNSAKDTRLRVSRRLLERRRDRAIAGCVTRLSRNTREVEFFLREYSALSLLPDHLHQVRLDEIVERHIILLDIYRVLLWLIESWILSRQLVARADPEHAHLIDTVDFINTSIKSICDETWFEAEDQMTRLVSMVSNLISVPPPPTGEPLPDHPAARIVKEYFDTVQIREVHDLWGKYASRPDWHHFLVTHTRTNRLPRRTIAARDAFIDSNAEDHELARELVEWARAHYGREADVVASRLAKYGQAPDFSIPRDILGTQLREQFPESESFDGHYAGPNPVEPRPESDDDSEPKSEIYLESERGDA